MPFFPVESEPKHMVCPGKPPKWLWEADKLRACSFCSYEMQPWGSQPCLCFSPGNALLVHPVTEQEAKAVSVLLPGSEEVRMTMKLLSCSAQISILYSNLPAPHLVIAKHCRCAKCWPAILCHSEPSFHLDTSHAWLTVNLLSCFSKSCCTNLRSPII